MLEFTLGIANLYCMPIFCNKPCNEPCNDTCVCVCVCVYVCVRACVCVCACACMVGGYSALLSGKRAWQNSL